MSKIFRLHSGAGENVEHWQSAPGHLSDNFINSIEDPAGSNANTQITSIPSPFARMDLVRTAFRYVAGRKELDGVTIYHRMLSDCLDVAEIFFNIEALRDKIEILEWNAGIISNGGELGVDPNSELGQLLHAENPKHRLLGETLKMYLFQDQKAFNFSDLKHCYLLNYKQGPEMINIIGGTSPATLFFSSANNLSFVDIRFGNDRVFDSQYCPLHKRSKDFIVFFYQLRNTFSAFSDKFPDINSYMDQCFELLDNTLKDRIRTLQPGGYDTNYNRIAVNTEGNNVEILGLPLRAKNYSAKAGNDDNDFIIAATRVVDGLVPCVLPNEAFNDPLQYAGGIWQHNYHEQVPAYDARPLSERTLPNQAHVKYPYLTVSDLLEPYLIKVPYPLDTNLFFDGNYECTLSSKKDHGFILPLKKQFFEYFSIQDLQGVTVDGRKMIQMTDMPGGMKVTLRIPIQKNRYIQFSRLYSNNRMQDTVPQVEGRDNKGIVIDHQITMAIYPFIRLKDGIDPHYRVMMVDRDVAALTRHQHYSLSFYRENNVAASLKVADVRRRSDKHQESGVSSAYYILEQNFDFVEVANNLAKGLIIPLFKPQPVASKTFKFAIDFGTTNTHIEYKSGNEEARAFDITEKDAQMGTLHAPSRETEEALMNPVHGFSANKLVHIISEEFLPLVIGQQTQYKFPQRTVVNDNGIFNPEESNYALGDFNIPFWYLKEAPMGASTITPNLKWIDFRNDKRFEKRAKGFLKQLLLMIRNKVLLNGGDLNATEIVWFYPSSMPQYRRNFLHASWQKYYQRYFGNQPRLYRMSESFAPFYYYYHKENVRPHDRPAVSIDIGGGTTDIVVYKSEKPVLLTSFRFGANALFGDGYGNTSQFNGFVQHYEQPIHEALSATHAKKLTQVYNELKQSNSSSLELIEFFFSLEDNQLIRDNRISLSFSQMLEQHQEFKIVFVLFYAAIIYHVARLMKTKGLPIPEYITFSGNGSKVIKLASSGDNLNTLLAYTKMIFADIYEVEQSPQIEYRFFKSPKEITCKGGLECKDYQAFELLENEIRTVLIGNDHISTIPGASLPYSGIENSEVVGAVTSEVSAFIDRFFNWHSRFNYYNNFGISPRRFNEYKELLNSKIKVDLISGIKEKLEEVNDNVNINIEETLFFYPLIGGINRLANKIQHDNKN
ncbi:Ppx/GppA phosphatase family protein [Chitinophaga eiseniae]|uniref:Ppx/GppA phosphatase family protein n=1 Tax=Chitinophaga eiseniae TaxID=634771 RepID=A0A1T4NEU7_9BACT|nr:hypothetical protein [Chitinophaga eiseniae]SJZ77596.1 Ppx/GppA phosphatase family protein [Chitinophaga eiseniae]